MKTTTEAARELGISPQRVQQFCRQRKMKRIGGMYLLTDDDIAACRERIGKRGRRK